MYTPSDYLSPSSIGLFRDCPQKIKLSDLDKEDAYNRTPETPRRLYSYRDHSVHVSPRDVARSVAIRPKQAVIVSVGMNISSDPVFNVELTLEVRSDHLYCQRCRL